jgi:hypothetical protein
MFFSSLLEAQGTGVRQLHIYREAARSAKDVKDKGDFALNKSYKISFATFADSLSGRFSFIGHGGSKGFGSGLSGLGVRQTSPYNISMSRHAL